MSAPKFQIVPKTVRLAGVLAFGLLIGCDNFNDPGMNPALLERYSANLRSCYDRTGSNATRFGGRYC